MWQQEKDEATAANKAVQRCSFSSSTSSAPTSMNEDCGSPSTQSDIKDDLSQCIATVENRCSPTVEPQDTGLLKHEPQSSHQGLTFLTPEQTLDSNGAQYLAFFQNLMLSSLAMQANANQQQLQLPPSINATMLTVVAQTLQMMSERLYSNNANLQLPSMFGGQSGHISTPFVTAPQFTQHLQNPSTPSNNLPQDPSNLHHQTTDNNNIKQEIGLHPSESSILRNMLMVSPKDHCDILNIDNLSQCIATVENRCSPKVEPQATASPSAETITKLSLSLLSKAEIQVILKISKSWFKQCKLEKVPYDVPVVYQKITEIMAKRYGGIFGTGSRLYLLFFLITILIHFSNVWTHSDDLKVTEEGDRIKAIHEFITRQLHQNAYSITEDIEIFIKQIALLESLLAGVSGCPEKVFQTVLKSYLKVYHHQGDTDRDDNLIQGINDILEVISDVLPKIHPLVIWKINRICALLEGSNST